ncbi:MAG: squalene/phytoene synthase family protein [Chloroflexota bacterium]
MAVQSWEDPLLALAYEAFSSPARGDTVKTDNHALENAYRYCANVTSASSRTFYLAAALLPKSKRRAAHALYAFCRSTDDLIDKLQVPGDRGDNLADWRRRLTSGYPTPYDPVPLAWADAQANFDIPRGYASQLFDGIARDLTQNRYTSFAELTEYCYSVASTVGLMVMHIVNFQGEAALPYAVKLGIALQLTNILRDVGEDFRAGRLYLPLDELAGFGLTQADVAAGRVDDRWRAFMRFQIERTRTLYQEAEPGIALLDSDGRFAIASAAHLYRAILGDIEAHDFDVFHRRAHVGRWGKFQRLPATWWNSKRL